MNHLYISSHTFCGEERLEILEENLKETPDIYLIISLNNKEIMMTVFPG